MTLVRHEVIGTERLRRFSPGEFGLWTLALGVVVLCAGSLALIVSARATPPAVPVTASEPAIVIDLAPLAVASEPEDRPEPVAEPTPWLETPAPLTVQPAQPVEAMPVTPAAEAEVEATQPLEPQETVPVDQADPVEPLQPSQVVPELVEAAKAEVAIPSPRPIPKVAQSRKKRPEPSQKPKPKAQPGKATSADSSSATKKASVSSQKWQSQVLSHLNRSKRYPQQARRDREEGIAQLQFVIDAGGRVTSAKIVRSSGSAALDRATLDMVHRASPVPAPPASMGQDRVTLTVPINFTLR